MTRKLIPAVIIFSIFACSCNRYYYKPNAINDPLFTKGGQVHAAFVGSIGSGDDNEDKDKTYFTDLQLGFSPINHLAFIGSYSTYAYRPYNKNTARADAYMLEGGVGGYAAFGKKKVKMIVDLYAGGGGGALQSDVNMNFTKLFLQPGIGMRSNSFDAVINFRFTNMKYSDLVTNGHDFAYLSDKHLIDTTAGRRIDNGSYTFYEPGITLRAGYKFVKVQLQSVFAIPLSNVAWHYNAVRYTVGLHFNLEDMLSMGRDEDRRRED